MNSFEERCNLTQLESSKSVEMIVKIEEYRKYFDLEVEPSKFFRTLYWFGRSLNDSTQLKFMRAKHYDDDTRNAYIAACKLEFNKVSDIFSFIDKYMVQ